MTYLVQFKRFRRGVPEVIGTLPIAAANGAAALAFARSLAGMRRWPTRTDALRVMDDGGRTAARLDSAGSDRAAGYLRTYLCSGKAKWRRPPPRSIRNGKAPRREPINARRRGAPFCCGTGRLLRRGWSARAWKGGYEIVRLDDPHHGPRYAIRSADQSYDRIVHEHELREDLGARGRGR